MASPGIEKGTHEHTDTIYSRVSSGPPLPRKDESPQQCLSGVSGGSDQPPERPLPSELQTPPIPAHEKEGNTTTFEPGLTNSTLADHSDASTRVDTTVRAMYGSIREHHRGWTPGGERIDTGATISLSRGRTNEFVRWTDARTHAIININATSTDLPPGTSFQKIRPGWWPGVPSQQFRPGTSPQQRPGMIPWATLLYTDHPGSQPTIRWCGKTMSIREHRLNPWPERPHEKHTITGSCDNPRWCLGTWISMYQAFREFLVSLALISKLNGHKSVELSHVKCKILTYFMMSFICSL